MKITQSSLRRNNEKSSLHKSEWTMGTFLYSSQSLAYSFLFPFESFHHQFSSFLAVPFSLSCITMSPSSQEIPLDRDQELDRMIPNLKHIPCKQHARGYCAKATGSIMMASVTAQLSAFIDKHHQHGKRCHTSN